MQPIKPFNGLSLEVAELLAVLAEECGDVTQRIGKILRHGLRNNPYTGKSNREQLEQELTDIASVCKVLDALGVIDWDSITSQPAVAAKLERLARPGMLHHSSLLTPKPCTVCGSTSVEQIDGATGPICFTHR